MKTIYYTASSLDGFIADEEHSLDWLFQFGEVTDTDYPDFIRQIGAAAMGASTYEWLWRNHIAPDAPQPMPWPYDFPVRVFTHRTLPTVPNADIQFVKGDIRPVHEEMAIAASGRDVWVVGGGDLARQFAQTGLLDEMWVTMVPVLLGEGKPLFTGSIAKPPLQVLDVHRYGPDFVQVRLALRTLANTCGSDSEVGPNWKPE